MSNRVAVAVAAAIGALVLAAAVGATIPDGSGVIHGCYGLAGILRVVDTSKGGSCLPRETTLTWNTQGRTGAQGPPGPQGPQGPKGDPGTAGSTYTAGTGLGLSGTTFGIAGSYQLPQGCSTGQSPFLAGFPLTNPWSCFTAANANQSCPSGQFQNGVDSDGNPTCAVPSTDASSGPAAWVARTSASTDVPENGLWTTILSLSLPAGSFVIDGTGQPADDLAGNNEVIMDCRVQDGLVQVANLFRFVNAEGVNGIAPTAEFAMHDIVTFPAPTTIDLACRDDAGSDHLDEAVLTALKLGTVN